MFKSDEDLLAALKAILVSPLSMREILGGLKIPSAQRSLYRRRIRTISESGEVVRIKGGRYGLPEKMNLVTGMVQGHPEGFGFVIPDDPSQSDLFLSHRAFDEAMHGDKVVARVESVRPDGRREGRVIRVLDRAHETVVGTFERSRNAGYVVPFERRISRDIFIPPDATGGARQGQAVVAKIVEYPSKTRPSMGEITKVLGDADDPAVEIQIIVARYKLRSDFPHAAAHEAKSQHPPTAKDLTGRLDLRARPIVTIDGETAKDFDDAVEVERLENGDYKLGVHIADVSHYVKEGSALDKEAYKRGTSVYFPGSVIPMLPFELSNDLCSLNPKVDRLTLSCIMTFNPGGDLVDYHVAESVIRSVERMTYTAVAAIIENRDAAVTERYHGLVKNFRLMAELAGILRRKRAMNGALDFDLPEPQIILDVTGRPESIVVAERNVAHRLIEEFMLAANRTVAGHFIKSRYPAVFRVHDEPDPVKLEAFREFIQAFGFGIRPGDKITSRKLQGILEKMEGRPEEKLITHVMLRSMKQARYSTDNIGHFGLAFEHYTHFTSPIRRYPDLIVHRLLRDLMRKQRREEQWTAFLPKMADSTSAAERNADEAERQAVKLRQCQYMKERIGEEYDGVISGVIAFGFFVEAVATHVEGLVRITSIADDYYKFDEKGHALIGERTRKRFRLGDMVRIRVENVSVERRQIDFSLVKKGEERAGRGRGEPKRAVKPKRRTSEKRSGARSGLKRKKR
ncbi:MAG: ribonuclease R [Nitrospinae bacterium]|nr:ribonuclease R [Nitrospinota bacterium]